MTLAEAEQLRGHTQDEQRRRTSRYIQRRATSFFEFGLSSPPWMAYTFARKMNWPDLSSFEATVGRLATAEDTRANRASFLLEVDGIRIGTPIDMKLPTFALYRDEDAGVAKRVVVFQAEEADGRRYFGGWLIDDRTQILGFEEDFELLTEEQIQEANKTLHSTAGNAPV